MCSENQMRITIDARRIHFDFTLPRDKQVIVLQGKSGTYKSTLFNVLEHYYRYGSDTGITVECEKEIGFIGWSYWEHLEFRELYFEKYSNNLYFIYEGTRFFKKPEFAEAIKVNKTNQYVIITREQLKYISRSDCAIIDWNKEKKSPWKNTSTYTEKL